jgi:hypothetical protein
MRKSLVLATLIVFACSAAAFAAVPDPTRSGCQDYGKSAACQYKFRNNGTLDKLTLKVTLRDTFDAPVASCSTYCNLVNPSIANNGKQCGGNRKGGLTNAGGVVNFIYRCIGGRGTVDLRVTAVCAGNIGICSRTISYTSTDLNASRDSDNGATTISDLGLWSGCLPPSPYCTTSDYDCNGTVNISDLGIFAGGLGVLCTSCPQ